MKENKSTEHITININKYLKELGENIKNIRKSLKMSQEDLAWKIGKHCNARTISKYERAEMEMRVGRLLEICYALGTNPSSLIPSWHFNDNSVIELWHAIRQLDAEHLVTLKCIAQAILAEQINRQKMFGKNKCHLY